MQQTAKLKVLAVDDTALQRAMLEHFLVKGGYEVILADSGEAAVELFASHAPDIVLLDVVMEGINGFETARELRKIASGRYVPIVYLTAQANEDDMLAGLEAGGDDYLFKPVNYALLKAKLQSFSRSVLISRQIQAQTALLKNEQSHARECFANILAGCNKASGASFCETQGERFCGESLTAVQGGDGRIWCMALSSPSQDLAGALWMMPLLMGYLDMAKKGYALPKTAERLNELAAEFLPETLRVDCALLAADPRDGSAECLSCGFAGVWIATAGRLSQLPCSFHPLGFETWKAAKAPISRFSIPKGSYAVLANAQAQALRCPAGNDSLLEYVCKSAPDAAGAAKLWEKALPASAPQDGLPFDALAVFIRIHG